MQWQTVSRRPLPGDAAMLGAAVALLHEAARLHHATQAAGFEALVGADDNPDDDAPLYDPDRPGDDHLFGADVIADDPGDDPGDWS